MRYEHNLTTGEVTEHEDAPADMPPPADIPPPPTYQQLRAAEYNLKSTGEQFGMMFDDQVNSTTTWLDWQQGIKDRIPK
jgi:hypothetical protein